jgi:predicted metalloprotease
MRWQGRRTSGNVEDRRGMSGGKLAVGGGIGTIVIALIIFLMGGNPGELLDQLQVGGNTGQTVETTAAEDEMAQLQVKLNAPGDFAKAYVIAHEVGHHVQKLLGIMGQVQELRGQVSEKEYNELSVRLELQADFFAGVWAYHAEQMFGILEEGDIEEAMNAAEAVGDDHIQMETQGYIVPDAFTHGTSKQRLKWFMKGFKTGDISLGDTFAAKNL